MCVCARVCVHMYTCARVCLLILHGLGRSADAEEHGAGGRES